MDFERAVRGKPLRYQAPKKRKKQFTSDGRAPDTTKELVGKRAGAGRPKNSRNKVPKLGNDVDWSTFGIPWSFNQLGFRATNTCPLDTTLMAFYLLHRFDEASLMREQSSLAAGALQQVLDESTLENYNKARWLWCTEVLKIQNNRNGALHDLYEM